MASPKRAIAAVRARIREYRAIVTTAEKADAAARQAVAPAQKRSSALNQRQSKMLMLTSAGGTPNSDGGGISLANVATISLGYGREAEKMSAKDLAAAMLSGTVKINGGRGGYGSTSYTLRGYLRRCKMIDLRRLRLVNTAVKRRKAAQQALSRAWRAEADAYIAAMEIGDKVDEVAIANMIAARFVAGHKTQPDLPHELNQKAHDARRQIEDLQRHLDYLTSTADDKPDACPCYDCAGDRQEAIRRRDLEAMLDSLNTVMGICPTDSHGKHRIAVDRKSIRLDPQARERLEAVAPGIAALLPENPSYYSTAELDAPRGWCRKGKEPNSFIRVAVLKDELEKAAKAKAKAEKRPPKPKVVSITPTATGDPSTLDFICPSCSERSPFDVENDEDGDGGFYVSCSWCGYEGDPDVVKTVARSAAA